MFVLTDIYRGNSVVVRVVIVGLGGPVVIILATGFEVCRLKPGQGNGFF